MAGMREACTVCGRNFEVQFRYQMEEREGAFSFFCSQACHGKSLRGETTEGVVCDACNKRFVVELVSQVVRIKGEARYACGEGCRSQLLAEAGGQRLGNASVQVPTPIGSTPLPGFAAPKMAAPPAPPPPVATVPVAGGGTIPMAAPRRLA